MLMQDLDVLYKHLDAINKLVSEYKSLHWAGLRIYYFYYHNDKQ